MNAAKPASPGPDTAGKARRRVYLLHSGLHTILSDPAKNIAAETLKDGLRKRGVAEKDLIVLDNPFPYASWKSLLPFESLTMFFEAAEPASKMSHDSYLRMHKALQARGVGRADEVVWIGHSAGGQIGLTMAHLARNLAKFPTLAKETSPYQFDMVITLGAAANLAICRRKSSCGITIPPRTRWCAGSPKSGPGSPIPWVIRRESAQFRPASAPTA